MISLTGILWMLHGMRRWHGHHLRMRRWWLRIRIVRWMHLNRMWRRVVARLLRWLLLCIGHWWRRWLGRLRGLLLLLYHMWRRLSWLPIAHGTQVQTGRCWTTTAGCCHDREKMTDMRRRVHETTRLVCVVVQLERKTNERKAHPHLWTKRKEPRRERKGEKSARERERQRILVRVLCTMDFPETTAAAAKRRHQSDKGKELNKDHQLAGQLRRRPLAREGPFVQKRAKIKFDQY